MWVCLGIILTFVFFKFSLFFVLICFFFVVIFEYKITIIPISTYQSFFFFFLLIFIFLFLLFYFILFFFFLGGGGYYPPTEKSVDDIPSNRKIQFKIFSKVIKKEIAIDNITSIEKKKFKKYEGTNIYLT